MGTDSGDGLQLKVGYPRISFDEIPIPGAIDAIVDLNLLAWTLVGAVGGSLDIRHPYTMAAAAAGVPELGATVHAVLELNGVEVENGWQQARLDATGRHGPQVDDASRAAAFEIRVNLDEHPASARLRALITLFEPYVPASELRPARNALLVAHRLNYLPDPELMWVSDMIATALADENADLTAVPHAVLAHMQTRRDDLAIDARSAGAMLIAAYITESCAGSHTDPAQAMLAYRKLLALAAISMQHGDWRNSDGLVARAAGDGYLGHLATLAEQFYSRAKIYRDYALASPPDPLEFARRLYEIAPYAAAAAWIGSAVRAAQAEQTQTPEHSALAKVATDAEELAVRTSDGLDIHYMHCVIGQIHQDRRAVAAAVTAGQRDEVFRFLREGEFRLTRPQSYRAFLEGKSPDPPAAML